MTKIDAVIARRAKKVTQELINHPLSYSFREPITEEAEHASDYFRLIKTPMDLSTVGKKLESKQYSSFEEWNSDILLIWDNALRFNKANTIYYRSAEKMKKFYTKRVTESFLTEQETWIQHSKERIKRLHAALKAKEKPRATKQ